MVKRCNQGSVPRLDGARGRRQVSLPPPHVRTYGLSEQMYSIEESTRDIVGTFRRPGRCAPCPPLVTPLITSAGEFDLQKRTSRIFQPQQPRRGKSALLALLRGLDKTLTLPQCGLQEQCFTTTWSLTQKWVAI